MIEEALKNLACTESEDGSWEIITNSFEQGKELRLIHYTKQDTPIVLDIDHSELNDLINFLDKLQGRNKYGNQNSN